MLSELQTHRINIVSGLNRPTDQVRCAFILQKSDQTFKHGLCHLLAADEGGRSNVRSFIRQQQPTVDQIRLAAICSFPFTRIPPAASQ